MKATEAMQDSRWFEFRRKVEDELSAKNGTWCVCGRLATGLHESGCRKFRAAVDRETVKRLKMLPKKGIAP